MSADSGNILLFYPGGLHGSCNGPDQSGTGSVRCSDVPGITGYPCAGNIPFMKAALTPRPFGAHEHNKGPPLSYGKAGSVPVERSAGERRKDLKGGKSGKHGFGDDIQTKD